ncbi:FtsW/RodA/SpoVE family cell cycle protein [Massilimicrobiota sp. An80]|uniref:FtsW/RodA/SpoVE family cell cycle protein n=1 Tax=Massilimicrobiota sp. An80 TaxID=1965658 RepID=UPI000B44E983|nr:FtsW/RodA/SpoVE family cell cycle protein [Massilimicrobiota sp. An80]OUN32426.1 stage V sporulation protein E [Massilimicrobiota sp. An80]
MINLLKRIFKRRGVDKTVYFCVVILTIYGIVMIGSASVGQSAKMGPMYASMNMIKQAIFVLGGFATMIFLTRCFKKSWVNANSTWIFYAIGLVLMLACLFFEDGKGSHAWIRIGSFTIQPAEFMKVIMILFLSFHFGEIEEYCQIPRNITRQKKEELQKRKLWYCILRPILAIFIAFFVGVFLQKDMGSSLIMAFICMMLFFITPRPYYTKYKKLALILLVIGFILILLSATFILKPYQLGRIYTWLNPLGDIEGDGWQLTNALIAFATGGLFGKGFGSSTQKYGYIPESHNDFIVAIIYEELGLVGFMLFLIPYVIIIYKMFHYALRIKDTKSKLILYGVGLYFFTHLLVNVGGVSGFIPMTGVPLLLISSGGSSTLAAMMGLGIAQSIIAKYNRDLLKEQME